MNEHDRLRQMRQVLCLSQAEMGKLVGLKQGSYSDVERGKASLSAQLLRTLLEQHRVNPAYVLCGISPMFIESPQTAQPQVGIQQCPYLPSAQAADYLPLRARPHWRAQLPQLAIPGLPGDAHTPWLAMELRQDDMIPTLYPGDVVLARELATDEPLHDNRIYVVVLRDGSWTIKRVLDRRTHDHTLVLKSDNRSRATYPIAYAEVDHLLVVHRRFTAKLQGPDDVYARLNALEQAIWDLQQQAAVGVAGSRENV